jgi:hypothetical protein
VLNVVSSWSRSTGEALAGHRSVDKIAFTGSTATGIKVAHAATANLNRATLELGGKSPQIVFPDADLEAAATALSRGVCGDGPDLHGRITIDRARVRPRPTDRAGSGPVPDNWRALRVRWEAGHATGFVLFLAAFVLLLLARSIQHRSNQMIAPQSRHPACGDNTGSCHIVLTTRPGMSPSLEALPKLAAPAARALRAAGYTQPRQLAGMRRSDLARLHVIGPKALKTIESALQEHGLSLS